MIPGEWIIVRIPNIGLVPAQVLSYNEKTFQAIVWVPYFLVRKRMTIQYYGVENPYVPGFN